MGLLDSVLGLGAAFATGGASVYWQAAAFLYSFAKGGPPVAAGELSDLRIALDGEGQELPRGWGRWRQELPLVWTSGLIEKRKTKKKGSILGIGGTKVTTIKRRANGLLIGGQGPITRLNRLKLNQFPEYDWNGGDEQGGQMADMGGYLEATTSRGVVIRVFRGTLDQPVPPLLVEDKGSNNWTNYPDKWLIEIQIPDLERFGGAWPRATVEVDYLETDLADVILEIGSWVGLEPIDFDLSALAGLTVSPTPEEGFPVDSRRKAADIIGELMEIYGFSLPEVDGVLRAVLRPSGFVASIPEASLRVRAGYEAGEVASAPLKEADEENLSRTYEYLFRDPNREYAPGYRFSRRFDAATEKKVTAQTSASMHGARASGIVRRLQAEEWAAAQGRDASLGIEYLWLAAGDEVLIETPDGFKPMLLDQTDVPLFGPFQAKWQGFDPLACNLPDRDESAGITRPTPIEAGTLVVFAGEIPIVAQAYLNQKAYIVGACRATAASGYRGATVNVDTKVPGGDWVERDEDEIEGESIIGELIADWTPTVGVSAAGPSCQVWGGQVKDAVSSAGAVNLILFSTGLICRVQSVTETASNGDSRFYTVDAIRAGVYGTDDFAAPLTAGTRFILLCDENGTFTDGPQLGGVPAMPLAGTTLRLRINEQDGGEQVTWNLGAFVGENTRVPSPVVEATRAPDGALTLGVKGRTRFYETATLDGLPAANIYREKEFSQGFKSTVNLSTAGHSASVTRYTTDDRAQDTFAFTAAELAMLLSRTTAQIAGDTIVVSVAQAGEVSLGRAITLMAAPPDSLPAGVLTLDDAPLTLDGAFVTLNG